MQLCHHILESSILLLKQPNLSECQSRCAILVQYCLTIPYRATTALVVIDSRLHELKLPLVAGPGDGGRAYTPRLALQLVDQYFEWIALVEEGMYPPVLRLDSSHSCTIDDVVRERDRHNKSLMLSRTAVKMQDDAIWKWVEASTERRGFSERLGTTFLWPEDDDAL